MTTLSVPVVGAPRPLKAPRIAEAKLRNGLRVMAVRKPSVPRVVAYLVAPLGGNRNVAAERVLAKTLTSGTSEMTSVQIAEETQRLGASFLTGLSPDNFQIGGSVLAPNLGPFIELLTSLITDPTFPADEVALERDRVLQEIEMSRSQAEVAAAEMLRKRLFGRHRYGVLLPEPSAVKRISRASVERLHRGSVGPRGGVLVLVGDLQPQAAIELADASLGRWRTKVAVDAQAALRLPQPGPMLLADRPGSVQTCFKIAGEVPALGTDDSYAVDIANTIFGGYFVSRWVDNLRERNGYTYSPHSALVHMRNANYLEISADVGTDVTAASLVETAYELGRMCATEVTAEELESAKRYRTGIQSLRLQSQAGLASTLASLVIYGLGVDYLKTYPQRVMALTAAEIREASAAYLAPSRLTTVMVGDADRVSAQVAALGEVRVQQPTT